MDDVCSVYLQEHLALCCAGSLCGGTTVEPLNKRHFGDNINSADLFFVERFSSLGGSKCVVGIILGP